MASPKKADCTPEEWAKHLAAGRAYREANRERERARGRERYARDAETFKQRAREQGSKPSALERRKQRQRERISGVTPGMFEALWRLQGGRCGVCSRELRRGPSTHADHCHDTKRPRGLLCATCNTVEGFIRRMGLPPADFGDRLARYLAQPPADDVCDLI